jgi:hypothetical protein
VQQKVWRIALPIYWVALIAATHYPRVPLPQTISHSDKVVHFGAFGVLAFLVWRFFQALTNASVWIAAAVLVPYAALDEYTSNSSGGTRISQIGSPMSRASSSC